MNTTTNVEYMVRNYSPSVVGVSTRDSHYLIPGGTEATPAEFPMSLAELTYVNSTTDVFRIGILFFDPADEEDAYKALRIRDWKNILRTKDIDDIILNPTTEKLQRVLDIRSPQYFDRIYGRFVALRNYGRPISGTVERILKARKKELSRGTAASEIKVSKVTSERKSQKEIDEQMLRLQAQVEELTRQLQEQLSANTSVRTDGVPGEASANVTKLGTKRASGKSKGS